MKSLLSLALLLSVPCALAQNQWRNWESPQVHPLERTPDGQLLLAVNTADQRLEVFTLPAGGLPVWRNSIVVGMEPVSVRARGNGEAWVVNQLSDNISVVDLVGNRLVRNIDTGDEPADVVFAGTPQRAFVSVSQLNQLRIFDPANPGANPQILNLQGEEPRALATSPDGARVYVGFFESGNGSTIVEQTDVSNPAGPYGGLNPPPNRGNTFSPALAAGLPAPPPVAQIVRKDGAGRWRDDNSRDWSGFISWNLADHDLAIIDSSTLAVSHVDRLMTTVMALGVRPDGRVAAVGTEALNQLRFEPNVQSIFIRVQLALADPANPGSSSVVDLNPQLDYSVRSVPVSTRVQALGDPRAIVWSADGASAWISGMGSNNVILANASGARLARIDVGQGPTGLVLDAAGSRLYVLNRFDASISSIDTASRSELGRVSFFDPTTAAVKTGRPMLYNTHSGSGLGQASCASCHIDGRSDFLAWDLGDPAGQMKTVNQPCLQGQTCRPWHPMKGPLVTQVLQGIVGNGAMHWRGDRENLPAFANAFVSLQGADQAPGAQAMQEFEAFVATLLYPPNPNRGIDGALPTSLAVTGGTGNAQIGLQLYQTLPVLGGNTPCITCHALPTGTSQQIDDPNLVLAPQSMKQAQLRGLWEKNGWSIARQDNTKGFGFNGDSEFDTLNALLLAGFNFGPPNLAPQRRRDVEAFMLAFDSESHAATGAQVLLNGSNNTTELNRLNTFISLANTGSLGLIAQRVQAGSPRGWVYVSQNLWLSDRSNRFNSVDDLRLSATAADPVLFTIVAPFTQVRAGIDRDADGWLDYDEFVSSADPADATSTPAPSVVCRGDFNADGVLDATDTTAFNSAFSSGSVRANVDLSLGNNGLPSLDSADQARFAADVAAGCDGTEPLLVNGFEA